MLKKEKMSNRIFLYDFFSKKKKSYNKIFDNVIEHENSLIPTKNLSVGFMFILFKLGFVV